MHHRTLFSLTRSTRAAVLLTAVVVAGEALAPPAYAAPGKDGPPNLVFIMADDMGYGDPGSYNPDSKIPTPAIDSLAKDGMRFTDAHTPSAVCTPTRYAVLTGRYCWRTELKKGVLWGYSPNLIDPERRTVASLLNEAGYTTGCVGKWHLGLGNEQRTDYSERLDPSPNDHGFDYFFGIPASLDMDPYVYVENDRVVKAPTETIEAHDTRGPGFWRAGRIAPGFEHIDVLPELKEKAVGFIDRHASAEGDPFFLYFPLPAPHTPCLPVPEVRGKSAAGDYGDFVVQVDQTVRAVLDALERNDVADNTLVIFTSDNGAHEPILPEDTTHDPNAPWRGQKADAWEGGHRVPFIARWPGHIEAGTVNDATCGVVDLMATCAAIVDTPLDEADAPDSISLLPAFEGKALDPKKRKAIVHQSSHGIYAIRKGSWKLIQCLGNGGFGWNPRKFAPEEGGPEGQLYNLEEDPGEQNNLYLERPEVVAQLNALLDEYQKSGRSVNRS